MKIVTEEMSTWHGLRNFNEDGEYVGPYILNKKDVEDQRIEILELLRNAGNKEIENKVEHIYTSYKENKITTRETFDRATNVLMTLLGL